MGGKGDKRRLEVNQEIDEWNNDVKHSEVNGRNVNKMR